MKYARITVRGKTVDITVPYNYDIDTLVKKHLAWIEKKIGEYELLLEKSKHVRLESRSMPDFYTIVHDITQSISRETDIGMPIIRFRKMKRKWASMNSNHIMTINTTIRFLPERLIRYIIFHEMCHTIEMSHNSKFKSLIRGKYPHYTEIDIELRAYWIAIWGSNLNMPDNY